MMRLYVGWFQPVCHLVLDVPCSMQTNIVACSSPLLPPHNNITLYIPCQRSCVHWGFMCNKPGPGHRYHTQRYHCPDYTIHNITLSTSTDNNFSPQVSGLRWWPFRGWSPSTTTLSSPTSCSTCSHRSDQWRAICLGSGATIRGTQQIASRPDTRTTLKELSPMATRR